MKRNRRSSSFRLLTLPVCYSLVVTTLFLPLSRPVSGATQEGDRARVSTSHDSMFGVPGRWLSSLLTFWQGGGLPSVPGANLPDLDAARALQPTDPIAPAAIPSNQACTDCTPCPTCGPGIANHAPVVKVGGPYFGTAGSSVVVNGLGSFDVDPADGISIYWWTFGDGSGIFHGEMPSHTYQSPGNYTVSLTVTDHHNASTTNSTTASIAAAPSSAPPSGTTQGNAALFIAQSVPPSTTAGESYPVSVTMRNTGTTTWTAGHLYRLGSQSPQDNSLWGQARIYLPTDVAPGADVTFSFTVIAPYSGTEEPPPAPFQWRMVEDGVQWFGDYCASQSVTIISNYQPLSPAPHLGALFDLFASRIAPQHRVGQPGEDLLSGNYNWGLGLVDLAGRSGLNLNFGLSYNSLAPWTKVVPPVTPGGRLQATSFTFDVDRGFPSVGFRLGFPSIQGPFSNSQTAGSSYLMLMPSGSRVELRQVGTTNVYETADSSYLQLLDGGNGSLLLRAPDGTQLAYWSINSEYRCTEVKDQNGNYITIKYDPINGVANLGRMTSVIDTLGRTLNFNYDSNYRLQSITQLRNGQTHVWATFGYISKIIQTNFVASPGEGPPVVLGLPANNIVSVLSQVGLDDGSRYTFDYTSWGQVFQITRLAADGHQLNFTSYNLPYNNSVAQSECPRFTQRGDGTENWNNNNSVATNFQIGWNGTSGQMTTAPGTPDEMTYKEFFTTDYLDWRRGLVTRTEIYSASSSTIPKKTTVTEWTQDDNTRAFPLNPRPAATTISDAEGNRRRTTVDYTSFGLPSDVYEMGPFGTNDWRVLRRTHTDYNLSDVYVNRRIIGLVSGQYLFGPDAPNSNSIQTLLSKTTFEYDNAICTKPYLCYLTILGPEEEEPEAPQAPIDPVVHHDPTYNVTFDLGRGLLRTIKRWDTFDEMNGSKVTSSSMLYNIYGSLIRSTDPLQHKTQIHYDDSFSNDGVSNDPAPFVTMAYPTSVSDPDGRSRSAKYNYDLGTVTRQQDPKGAAQTTQYDVVGRVKRVTNAVNGAYTRFVYPTSQTIVNKFATVNDLATETYTATVFDGAGRVRAMASDFPNSTTGHYSGQFTLYDVRGRAVQSTNPTEMTGSWTATGDDLAGWNSSSQTYDWKGRPLVTKNQDETTKEASYAGCGCAGGEVLTLTDEGTLVGTATKKRQQKIYSDALGRTVKTEVLNWDGLGPFGTGQNQTIYSTTVNTYNVLDQVTMTRQYAGAEGSSTFQDTIMTFDGYGRLKARHVPEQNIGTASIWDYNADDTIQKVTDARGASQTLSYNKRHQITSVSTSLSGLSTINVTYEYDEAGNRTKMTDQIGHLDYVYDQLSRLTAENRFINGLPNPLPSADGGYKISYNGYNLANQLTSITDPFNATTSFEYDTAGRTLSVSGSYGGNNYAYASSIAYRAWGAVKSASFGNGTSQTTNYDARLRPSQFRHLAPRSPAALSI